MKSPALHGKCNEYFIAKRKVTTASNRNLTHAADRIYKLKEEWLDYFKQEKKWIVLHIL